MTNNIRYDWTKVTPEVLQELAQAASDHEDYSCQGSIVVLGKAVQKARQQAIVMEIDQPKIDVLAAAEAYHNTRTGRFAMGKEVAALEHLLVVMRKAFGPKP